MIFNLFFSSFLFFLSLGSSSSLENPCVFHGLDYSGLSEFPDFPLSVANCESSAENDYLFSLCRPLRNSLGKSLNASAVQIGAAGQQEAIGIFPSKTRLSPVFKGNLSQGITIQSTGGSRKIFINIHCYQAFPLPEQFYLALLNPWLGQQTIEANMAVNSDGQCDTLEINLYSNCVCPGFGENPLKPCSPPQRPSAVSLAYQNFPPLSLSQPGPNGEIFTATSLSPSTIAFTTMIPQAFDTINKIPLNYSSSTANFEIPDGLNQLNQIFDLFPDQESNDLYIVTGSSATPYERYYSFFLVEAGKSLKFLFSSNMTGGFACSCVSRPNLSPHDDTKSFVCAETNDDPDNVSCSLAEYVYSIKNPTNMVKTFVPVEINNCPQISLSFDSSKIFLITDARLYGGNSGLYVFDTQSMRLLSNVSLPLGNNAILGLAVDQEENVLFLLQTSSFDFPNFPAIDYGVYQLAGKEFILLKNIPDMLNSYNNLINFFLDSFGCPWLLAENSLLRLEQLKKSGEKEKNKIYQRQ